jgi:hypothetical protein
MRDSVRAGAPYRLFLLVVLVVIAAAASIYFVSGQSKTSNQSTSSASTTSNTSLESPPSEPVRNAVDRLVQAFNKRDITALVNSYAFSGEVVWNGNAGGLAGAYAGSTNIGLLYDTTIGKTTSLNASLSNFSETMLTPSNANVTFTLTLTGNSTVMGTFEGAVNVSQHWIFSGGEWQIIAENWGYRSLQAEFPVSATTFPQWAALKTGQNPDLVSEKSFEWNAGPYVAASVYAFLGAVVVGFLMRRESRADVAQRLQASWRFGYGLISRSS